MQNDNRLKGMRCSCGSYGPFLITSRVWAEVTDEGVEEYTDCKWDENSYCICKVCGSPPRQVKDFIVKKKRIVGKK